METVIVYFESKNGLGAHEVAKFDNEETYMACLPALMELAEKKGYVVTESIDGDFNYADDLDELGKVEIDNIEMIQKGEK